MTRAHLALAIAPLVLLAACSGAVPRRLPDFALVNQAGHVVRADDLRGRAAVVSFVFTACPEVCPLVTAELARAQAGARSAGLASTVRFVSITVDPQGDTPEVLGRYAARVGADTSTWDFLTGAPAEVGGILGELGVFTADERGRLTHGTLVLVVDPERRIVRRYTDIKGLSARLLDEVRRLRRPEQG